MTRCCCFEAVFLKFIKFKSCYNKINEMKQTRLSVGSKKIHIFYFSLNFNLIFISLFIKLSTGNSIRTHRKRKSTGKQALNLMIITINQSLQVPGQTGQQ